MSVETEAADGTEELVDTYGFPVDLDPAKNLIWSSFGRKGSGKSYINRAVYRSYPFSKLCIDVNGNADPGPDAKKLTGPLPTSMPRPQRNPDTGGWEYPNLHYLPDPQSATYKDDLDRAVAMALFPQDQDSLVWIGELNQFSTGASTPPALRTLLQQSRHYHTSALFDCPRPVDIDRLVISQADVVTIFDMPDPDDRDRVAKVIGYPAPRFRAECDETFRRGEHWYLLWNSSTRDLIRCPPLPKGIA